MIINKKNENKQKNKRVKGMKVIFIVLTLFFLGMGGVYGKKYEWSLRGDKGVKIFLSGVKIDQGDTLRIDVRSDKKSERRILKVFGNMGEKKIYFLESELEGFGGVNYKGYVGFDIRYAPGKVKLLIAILFKDGEVKYFNFEVEVKRKVVTEKVRVSYWKKFRYLKKYWWKGKRYRRWVTRRRRVTKYISPPLLETKEKDISLKEFQEEIKSEIVEFYKEEEGIGGAEGEDKGEEKVWGGGIKGEEKEEDWEEFKKDSLRRNAMSETDYFNRRYQIKTSEQYWQGIFLQSTYPGDRIKVSKFGAYRVFRYRGRVRRGYHRGLDIARKYGSNVIAGNHGVVVIAGEFKSRGKAIVIDHGLGVYSVHYHLSRILVEEGMWVRKGQLIGRVGSTGISTGPHLHWEIRVDGVSVNPMQWRDPGGNIH